MILVAIVSFTFELIEVKGLAQLITKLSVDIIVANLQVKCCDFLSLFLGAVLSLIFSSLKFVNLAVSLRLFQTLLKLIWWLSMASTFKFNALESYVLLPL